MVKLISLIQSNLFLLMDVILNCLKFLVMFHKESACTIHCFCLTIRSYNMTLLFRIKHLEHILSQFSNCNKRQSSFFDLDHSLDLQEIDQ